MTWAPYAVAAWLFLAGLYGIVTSRHLVHLIVCVTVVQASTYVLLLGVGFRLHAAAPIYATLPLHAPSVDPVVQALCLTDVVVEVTVAAVLLALAVQAHKRFGTLDPARLRPMQG
ncbi:MAG: NADH-quinone oxidoreductase subunit K [Candidatus Dormibacteraeota bacterium]|nr:NADH-quinone oxidoreductase subunit K [Candidatus Dormibacteraeota bacterium]